MNIFFHTYKCGGTTIRNILSNNLKSEYLLSLYNDISGLGRLIKEYSLIYDPETSYSTNKKIAENYISNLYNKDKVEVVIGHIVFFGIHKFFNNKNVKYILLVRNPVELVVSGYNDRRYKALKNKKDFPDFEKWFKGSEPNIFSRYLNVFRCQESNLNDKPNKKELIEFINSVDEIWDIKDLNEKLHNFLLDFGIDTNIEKYNISSDKLKKVKEKPLKVDKRIAEIIKNRNSLDVDIYNECLKISK